MSISSARSAVAFLTIIPVADPSGEAGERLGRAYFPAVGALLGFGAGIVLLVASAFITPLVGAAAALIVLALVTGGLHLDGLADTADGLFGGRDRERRLEIMRDPRVGSFGAIALVLVLLMDVATLASITPARALLSLVVAGGPSWRGHCRGGRCSGWLPCCRTRARRAWGLRPPVVIASSTWCSALSWRRSPACSIGAER